MFTQYAFGTASAYRTLHGAPHPRIHVIGGPGSGKTTFARNLSVGRAGPAIDLDQVAYEQGAGAKRPLSARTASLAEIVQQPDWITEGIYLWWIEELLREADAIVWLDVPFRTAAWRIVVRHVRANLSGTNKHAGTARLLSFLRYVHRYYTDTALAPAAPDDDGAVTRAHTAVALSAYRDKVMRIASRST